MSKVFEALERARREQRRATAPGARDFTGPAGTARRLDLPSADPAGAAQEPSWHRETRPLPDRDRQRHSRSTDRDSLLRSFGERILSFSQPILTGSPWTDWDPLPELLIDDDRADNVSEQFQAARANLERCSAQREGTVLLVTSALAGEGKSFVSLNLAATLALSGTRVILIDADLRRPTLHRALNLAPLSGLKPYLEGQCDFASTLHRTAIELLRVIPAGGQLMSPSFLLGGARMPELVNEARAFTPPHLTIIDTPAALVCPDAQILSHLADGMLFVVGANSTPRAILVDAMQMFRDANIHGVILNRFQYSYSAARRLAYSGKCGEQQTTHIGLS